MQERRTARRRSLPFVRSAVLEADDREHIVAVTDLGPEGAFLSTRLPVNTGASLHLRFFLPGRQRELRLPCILVWGSESFDVGTGRPAGVAVRFDGLGQEDIEAIDEFVSEGRSAGSEPAPTEHFEYRILDKPALDLEELNLMGRDGWRLATTVPGSGGLRLVFSRRL